MNTKRMSTGAGFLDDFLEGGYETDAITTIYGPAGAGKTNLALLASIEIAKAGKKVIYIDTEGGFSVSRLKQILPDYKKLLERFVFLRPTNFEEQKRAIEMLKKLVNQRIGLIVVDTITMLYRLQRSFKEDDSFNRDLSLQMLALNEIARKHNIPVLLTSQVYASFENGRVKIVGGDILLYTSKCLLELEPLHAGKRKLVLRKHRSIAGGKEAFFEIVEKGIKESR
ncbi:MAG: DNA repair and recombination protein RadB [Candidatus Woesearchaeota archaeon]